MTIPEILNALESLRDFTNDNGKGIIESVRPAIRRLIDPDEIKTVTDVQVRRVQVEEPKVEEPKAEARKVVEAKEEKKGEPTHKMTKRKK